MQRRKKQAFIADLFSALTISDIFRALSTELRKAHLPLTTHLQTNMARAHYIVRVGNEGMAPKIHLRAPEPPTLPFPLCSSGGLPNAMTHVNVRAAFEADMDDPGVTTHD